MRELRFQIVARISKSPFSGQESHVPEKGLDIRKGLPDNVTSGALPLPETIQQIDGHPATNDANLQFVDSVRCELRNNVFLAHIIDICHLLPKTKAN